MDLLEPNWEQERPDDKEIDSMGNQLQITSAPIDSPSIHRVIDAFRETHSNGGALFGRYSLSPDPVLHWFGSRNRWDEIDFFDYFFQSQAIADTLADLKPAQGEAITPAFQEGSPFTLDGEIAQALCFGGAYERFQGSAREAKELGEYFCQALFDHRFDEVIVYKSFQPWSPWFHGIAWDFSWVIIDKRLMAIAVLCVTDTD